MAGSETKTQAWGRKQGQSVRAVSSGPWERRKRAVSERSCGASAHLTGAGLNKSCLFLIS